MKRENGIIFKKVGYFTVNIFQSLKKIIKVAESDKFDSKKHLMCPMCEGTGHEDMFTPCGNCRGRGLLNKENFKKQ